MAARTTELERDERAVGWVLQAIAEDEMLSRWAFKGGTCLKKCFFETYRFSEDLTSRFRPASRSPQSR